MKEKGFEVYGISSPGEFLSKFADREQVPTYAVAMPRSITPLRDLVAVWQLWRRLGQIRPAIVHSHTPKGGLLGMIAAWLARTPVRVYHMRGLPFITATGLKRRLLMLTEWVSCLLAHEVLCVSHSVREVAVSERLCPAGKVKVLAGGSGNGVDAERRFNPDRVGMEIGRATRRAYGIPDHAAVAGFVGRLVRDKGLCELAGAWGLLRTEFTDLHLLIVGPFEGEDPLPSDVITILKTDDRIHLTGGVPDTVSMYAAMDLLVLPTYREGFPNVLLEAAAMGLPVVATRVPGCVDAVADEETGRLVPAADAQALAEGIRAYVKDSELRRLHGTAGRERVLKSFRQRVIWEALYQEYRSILKQSGMPLPMERGAEES